MKKILLSEKIDDAGIKLLEKNGFKVRVSPSTEPLVMQQEIADAYAVIMRSSDLTKEIIEYGKELKIISRNGTGINNIDIESATSNNILVAKVNGANAYAVAEYVISTMLMLSRNIFKSNQLLHEKKSELSGISLPGFSTKYELNGHELKSKTLGILGLGHIGQILANIAQAFGMKVIAYDPFITENSVELYSELNDVLKTVDFLSINMPLTPQTKNLITSQEISLMKDSAFIINSARGGIINEDDLAEALNNGILAGAAIDAFDSEPPRMDNPLFASKNTIITSHIAGTTFEANKALGVGAAQAIIDFHNNKMPQFPVNPEVFKGEN